MTGDAIEFAGGRVVPFAVRHLTDHYVSWLNDARVVRFSEQRHRVHTMDSCRRYFESFRESDDRFLAIEVGETSWRHVGNIGVAVDSANKTADVSILLGDTTVWRTGVGSKAWCAVVDALAAEGTYRKITAGTMSVNTPMLRVLERSGMTIEATRRRHFLWEAQEVDLILAARFVGLPAPA